MFFLDPSFFVCNDQQKPYHKTSSLTTLAVQRRPLHLHRYNSISLRWRQVVLQSQMQNLGRKRSILKSQLWSIDRDRTGRPSQTPSAREQKINSATSPAMIRFDVSYVMFHGCVPRLIRTAQNLLAQPVCHQRVGNIFLASSSTSRRLQ